MVNKNYPHPVLSPYTDDFDHSKATFDIKISKKIDRLNYKLHCDVNLNEETLKFLLNNNKIKIVVVVICSSTRFRRTFQFDTLDHSISLPSSHLDKQVDIATYIVATNKIDEYSSSSFNEDYDGATFSIFPGDILAEGSTYKFNVDKKIDPLTKVPSIFTIVYSGDKKAPPMDVNWAEEKIKVTLNKSNFQKYKDLKELQNQYGYLAALTSSLFILPALTTVISNIKRDLTDLDTAGNPDAIKDYIDEYEGSHRWFKVINNRLKDAGIELNEPDNIIDISSVVIAQKLLGDPLSNGLQFFDELLNSGEEEDTIES